MQRLLHRHPGSYWPTEIVISHFTIQNFRLQKQDSMCTHYQAWTISVSSARDLFSFKSSSIMAIKPSRLQLGNLNMLGSNACVRKSGILLALLLYYSRSHIHKRLTKETTSLGRSSTISSASFVTLASKSLSHSQFTVQIGRISQMSVMLRVHSVESK